MRTARLTIVAALALISCFAHHAGGGDPPPARESIFGPDEGLLSDSPEDLALRARLRDPISNVNVEDISLDDFIEYLADLTGLPIMVNWTALETAAVGRDTPVELRLGPANVEIVLRAALEYVGAGETALAFEILDGRIKISTKEDLSRFTVMRVYECRDLLEWDADAPTSRSQYTFRVIEQYGGRSFLREVLANAIRKSNYSLSGLEANNGPTPLDKLIYVIQETVDPESWREAGGNVGIIQEYGGCLVISQTVTAHRQIEALLATLRRAADSRSQQSPPR